MAFNPALPLNNSPQSSAEMRAQFTGLKDMIDAAPSSPAMADAARSVTNSMVSGVDPLPGTVSNPPTQAEVQAIADKLDELINSLSA